MDGNTPVGGTTLAKLERASVKRIIKDLAATDPELFREAIIAGLQAPPPRSFPYLALAAAYLDGKPVDGEPPIQPIVDLSSLTREQLGERAEKLVRMLKSSGEVIDAEVVPNLDDLTPEQLQDEIRRADEEVRLTNEEVAKANAQLEATKRGLNLR